MEINLKLTYRYLTEITAKFPLEHPLSIAIDPFFGYLEDVLPSDEINEVLEDVFGLSCDTPIGLLFEENEDLT